MALCASLRLEIPLRGRLVFTCVSVAFGIVGYPLTACSETAQELYTYLKRDDISPDHAVDHLHNSQPDPDPGESISDSVPPRAYVPEDLEGFNELAHVQQHFIFWRARRFAGDHANSSGFTDTQRIKWNRFQSRLACQWISWYEGHETAGDWKDSAGFDRSFRTAHYKLTVYYAGDGLVSAKQYIQACDHFANHAGNQVTTRWLETWEKALFGPQQMGWRDATLDTSLCTPKDEQGMRQVDTASLQRWKAYAGALERFLNVSNAVRDGLYRDRLNLVHERIQVAERRVQRGNAPTPPVRSN